MTLFHDTGVEHPDTMSPWRWRGGGHLARPFTVDSVHCQAQNGLRVTILTPVQYRVLRDAQLRGMHGTLSMW